MERRLAVILAADVVGYSALMERDEAGTFARLSAGRKELFEPEIARHHGRIFKLMGDGLLAEFSSVVDAVECAVSLQQGLVERNASVPESERIQVRIGVNLGEVIIDGDDRYGEGVNIHPEAVVDHRRELDQHLPGCASEIENARSAQPAAELAQVTNSRREFGRPRRVGAMLRTP
jgi:hypothetical protein